MHWLAMILSSLIGKFLYVLIEKRYPGAENFWTRMAAVMFVIMLCLILYVFLSE